MRKLKNPFAKTKSEPPSLAPMKAAAVIDKTIKFKIVQRRISGQIVLLAGDVIRGKKVLLNQHVVSFSLDKLPKGAKEARSFINGRIDESLSSLPLDALELLP